MRGRYASYEFEIPESISMNDSMLATIVMLHFFFPFSNGSSKSTRIKWKPGKYTWGFSWLNDLHKNYSETTGTVETPKSQLFMSLRSNPKCYIILHNAMFPILPVPPKSDVWSKMMAKWYSSLDNLKSGLEEDPASHSFTQVTAGCDRLSQHRRR